MPLSKWSRTVVSICSKHLDFKVGTLQEAIEATFKNRETPLPAGEFEALTTAFAERNGVQWNAFVKKIGDDELGYKFDKVVEDLKGFVLPLLASAGREKSTQAWKAGKGWVNIGGVA